MLFFRLVQSGHFGLFFISISPFEDAVHSCLFGGRHIGMFWAIVEDLLALDKSVLVAEGRASENKSALLGPKTCFKWRMESKISYPPVRQLELSPATASVPPYPYPATESEARGLDNRHYLATAHTTFAPNPSFQYPLLKQVLPMRLLANALIFQCPSWLDVSKFVEY
jgi:hypothetical protein